MTDRQIHKLLRYCIAGIWLANGLFCKVLHLVPRHELIVSAILGPTYSKALTVFIGGAETAMAIWIIIGFKTRLNAVVQILIIAGMNTLEFILVPELLLWGKLNAIFALLLILIIYHNEFHLNKKTPQPV
jgi:hypothetical protein